MFQCGTLRCTIGDLWRDSDNPTPIDIPVPWFVILHPDGNIVIDGGNAPACITHPQEYWGPIADAFQPRMTDADTCQAGLKRIGIAPESVRYVLLSHLHADHTGALGRFPRANYVVRRVEYEQAYAQAVDPASGYLRTEVRRDDLAWCLLDNDASGSTDILGDGTVQAVSTPGHTEGHQSFLIKLKNTGYVLVTGDAAYTMAHWVAEESCGAPASAAASAASIRKLKRLADSCNAVVVPGHDRLAWPTFLQAPAWYD